MPQRSILVAVDVEDQKTASGKRRLDAVRRAALFLAQRLSAEIDLLYVEDMKAYHHDKWDHAGIRSWNLEHQTRLKLLSRQFEMPVYRAVKRGAAAEQILKESRSSELVVVGTRGVKGLRRLFVGSVAEEVIRHSKRPVMVVGPTAQERDHAFGGRKDLKILVATDLGRNSRPAERYALSLAGRIGARVVLYHCLSDRVNAIMATSAFSRTAIYHLDTVRAEARDEAVEVLTQKSRFFSARGLRCEYKLQGGLSRCSVFREAEGGYAMIIMGAHARNIVLSAYFGSTARETILNAPVPVITVHAGR